MPHLALLGDWASAPELPFALYHAGHVVTLTSIADLETVPALVVAAVAAKAELPTLATLARVRGLTWLAWCIGDDPQLILAAYQAGALAVLPARLTPEVLVQAIETVLRQTPATTKSPQDQQRRYRRGEMIMPDADEALDVLDGIVALTVVHPDGAEVLLGLGGPGQTLIGHPEDSCSLHLVAHTDVILWARSWQAALLEPDFPERLRARLRQTEAWAAMQARPHLDQRVLGLLALLAEQFGEPHPQGLLLNARLTHALLASAVGATRTTITRTLGNLRARDLLLVIATDDGERFCLRSLSERGDHLPHSH